MHNALFTCLYHILYFVHYYFLCLSLQCVIYIYIYYVEGGDCDDAHPAVLCDPLHVFPGAFTQTS